MILLVAGGRNYQIGPRGLAFLEALHTEHTIEVLIHGGAPGADTGAENWALSHGIRIERHEADWNKHGRAAGPFRNRFMVERLRTYHLNKHDTGVVLFPGGSGTKNLRDAVTVRNFTTIREAPPELEEPMKLMKTTKALDELIAENASANLELPDVPGSGFGYHGIDFAAKIQAAQKKLAEACSVPPEMLTRAESFGITVGDELTARAKEDKYFEKLNTRGYGVDKSFGVLLAEADVKDADFRLNSKPNAGRIVAIVDGPLPDPSPEQQRALEILSKTDGIVKRLSGKAGTGKSTVIRHLEQMVPITICATTAKAALNVGGTTLDRLFAYSREKDDCFSESKLQENMERCETIIVLDEASMLGRKMANYVQRCCQAYKKTLILVGDWAQAKPVKDGWITESTILNNAVTVFLTESHRQTDKPFLDALNALSLGAKTHPAYAVFDACKVRREPEGDHYVRLYATNDLTTAYNRSRLAELPDRTPRVPMMAIAQKFRGNWFPKEEERLVDDSRFMHNISLKLGARLMCTKNDYQSGFVNGDAGELIDVAFFRMPPTTTKVTLDMLAPAPDGRPTIVNGDREIVCWLSQFSTAAAKDLELPTLNPHAMMLLMRQDRTGIDILIPGSVREILDADDRALSDVKGFPVLLGWAQTIHKAQGATCDNVYVDMSSIRHFPVGTRHGLAYVALSRAKTLGGLKIYGWNEDAIECDPEVWRLLAPLPPPPPTPDKDSI